MQTRIRQALVDLDVEGMRRAWAHASPHLPQPATDQEALISMHLARSQMKTLPAPLKELSKRWLRDHAAAFPTIAAAVGVSVKPLSARNITRASDVQCAMTESVEDSYKAGVDLDTEADEVKLRMNLARDKIYGAT